uniref:Pre-mRNA-processing factor 19 n=1 Tax=Trypanosoma congolense (strain IL3000) TaxID=1068625 RepID=G0UJK4_TRYCI|nr:putative WD-repeat protein [Trypanosoma congolense IL3000]
MLCCISNRPPYEPVVSRSSGCLYERSLIEKYIAEHGRCPVTGETLHVDDLIAVRQSPVISTSAVSGDTVPNLLSKLHAQWDAIMLEQFVMRQKLAQTQQELEQALHQYEAACRVIAKLLHDSKPKGLFHVAEQEEEGQKFSLPDELKHDLDQQNSIQRSKRKSRTVPETLASTDDMHKFSEVRSFTTGKRACGADRPVDGRLFIGLEDATLACCDVKSGKVSTVGVGHEKAVRHVVSITDVSADSAALRVVSGSDDASLRLWTWEEEMLVCQGVVRHHSCGLVGLNKLTRDRLLISASSREVGLVDITRMDSVVCVTGASVGIPSITCLAAHPYGSIAAVGSEGGGFCVWNTAEMCVDSVVPLKGEGDVCSFSFNADCLTLAAGTQGGKVFLWDLRKIKEPIIQIPATKTGTIGSRQRRVAPIVAFDDFGKYLAVGGTTLRVYEWAALPENKQELCTLCSASRPAAGIFWGADARELLSCTGDGVVRVYGTA